LRSGLWKFSRHPNLFFELITWIGFSIIGINNQIAEFIGFLSPVFLWMVMNFLTIPITEKTMAKNRPETYQ